MKIFVGFIYWIKLFSWIMKIFVGFIYWIDPSNFLVRLLAWKNNSTHEMLISRKSLKIHNEMPERKRVMDRIFFSLANGTEKWLNPFYPMLKINHSFHNAWKQFSFFQNWKSTCRGTVSLWIKINLLILYEIMVLGRIDILCRYFPCKDLRKITTVQNNYNVCGKSKYGFWCPLDFDARDYLLLLNQSRW
jgi:hypothetical protein